MNLWETFAMEMPVPDSAIITRKDAIVAGLKAILPEPEAVISDPNETRAYECDALTAYRCQPLAVVLPATTEEVAAVLKFCHAEGVPVVPRGAGTSLAGGSLPTADSIVLGVSRMSGVLETNYANRYIRVQTGRTNLSVTGAVEADGFFYAPDPSSQLACAIAGNIAMNSGGAHCLKYGVTTNNLMGVKMVTMEGDIVDIGGAHLDAPVYDLLGLICGSEGQLGVVTEATLRILPKPEGARPVLMGFDSQRGRGRMRGRHHQGRRAACCHRVHGPALHPRDGRLRQGRLPGRRGPADRRGGRLRGRDREQLDKINAIAMKHNPAELRESAGPERAPPSGRAARPPLARWARSTITSASTAPSR
jgi:glycolate oxidase